MDVGFFVLFSYFHAKMDKGKVEWGISEKQY